MKEQPVKIPDVAKLATMINAFIEYMDRPEIIKMENDNKTKYESHMDLTFNELSSSYYSTFKLLLDRENRDANLERLIEMLDMLKEVEKGKMSVVHAGNALGEKLNEQYIYPQFGGKNNFMKKMAEPK